MILNIHAREREMCSRTIGEIGCCVTTEKSAKTSETKTADMKGPCFTQITTVHDDSPKHVYQERWYYYIHINSRKLLRNDLKHLLELFWLRFHENFRHLTFRAAIKQGSNVYGCNLECIIVGKWRAEIEVNHVRLRP